MITSAETLDSKVLFYWEVQDTLRAEIGLDFTLGKTGLLTWEMIIFISSQIYHTVLIQPSLTILYTESPNICPDVFTLQYLIILGRMIVCT